MRKVLKATRTGMALAAVAAFSLAAPTMASADGDTADAESEEILTTDVLAPGESDTVVFEDGTTMTLEVGPAEQVTAADIAADSSLTAAQQEELLEASAVAAVSSSHWSQFSSGITYTNTQNGTFYWNGSRVWVTQSYGGYTGTHRCFNNYTVTGWQIQNIEKSDSGSTTQRVLYCGWSVVQPTLITTGWSMTAYVNANGTVAGAGATKG